MDMQPQEMDEETPGNPIFKPSIQLTKQKTQHMDCKDEIHKENELVQSILIKLGDYDYKIDDI